jgi:hypothetical protein
MAVKYLKLDNTGIKREEPTIIGGEQHAGKLVALDETGKLDDSIYDLDNKIKGSLEINDNKIQLENDSNEPGNSKYYGTNSSGIKGFHDLPSGGSGGGSSTFTGLTDTPATYSGNENKYAKVKSDGTGLEFVAFEIASPASGAVIGEQLARRYAILYGRG